LPSGPRCDRLRSTGTPCTFQGLNVKCESCGYVSFDYNDACPACGVDLQVLANKLGIYWKKPDVDFHKLFQDPQQFNTVDWSTQPEKPSPEDDAEIDFGSDDDGFEFSLDD